ncbi:hypothetical protein GCK32_018548 [Trichostrongylus colubriformis]|uniref:Uncharacterized protein n=1 Tax=Trichostrongylus colubriformis TaxID=6319 RepID=A0AAN8IAC4_TRICO
MLQRSIASCTMMKTMKLIHRCICIFSEHSSVLPIR